MTNQLLVIEPEQFETTQRVAKAMVASGYFNDAKDVAQAIVKIMAGQEMGLPPFAAMTSIHVIKGKPVLGANALATLVKSHPSYDYRVKSLDVKGCTIAFYENGEHLGDSSFTAADAKAAGLAGGNWQKYPRNMMFARAISNGAKWFTPGIFGGAPVYTPEELGADVDEEGEIIDVTPEPVVVVDNGNDLELEDIPIAGHTITDKQRRQLHAVGTKLYGDAWDDKRAEMSAAFETKSSNDWTVEQAGRVIDGMNGKLAEQVEQVDLFEDK